MSQEFDVVVIGAGPGGYVAAIRAAQLGLKVACIEKWKNGAGKNVLGGTCLNVGCIPSKALLASSESFEHARHGLEGHGISVGNVSIDIGKMLARKDVIVAKMTQGIEFLFRKNKITWLKGHGRFIGLEGDAVRLEVQPEAGDSQLIQSRHVIIATGSKARHLPQVPVDNVLVCDNEGALSFNSVPKKLTVIGGGVIGLELGSVWRRLGADVTVLEMAPTFLGGCDPAVSKEAEKIFRKQGIQLELGVKIGEVKTSPGKGGKNGSVTVHYEDAKGKAHSLDSDRLIVSIGRIPNTDGLTLETVGLGVDERGFIPVDDNCRTSVPNIYAIGDVVRGPMLAHKGEEEGVAVAERIVGQKPHIDYNCIPYVIYTSPEIAWVGKNEAQLKAEGRNYQVGQFPFMANGRALGMMASDGFVKILADKETDEILGVHIIGSNASDLIAEAVVAMEFKASSEDIARICHPHPSLSEAVREAALAVEKRALNM
ncbi:MAG: dihydrolipoyl dehydrogenase [Lautropia sp.]|nr:dihydrolipoyl dehydrogenase [Lautropia sp.]